MRKINLKVNGMMCVGCENGIKNAVKDIQGVKKVSADHKSGMIKVVAKDNVGIDVIKESLEALDYEVVSGELR